MTTEAEILETLENTTSPLDWIADSLDPHPGEHAASMFLGKEFLLWLWWQSETKFGTIELPEVGRVDFHIDDRLQFKTDDESPQISDFKGGAPATTDEARASLLSGKVIEVARIFLRNEHDREYTLQLNGERLELSGVKVPGEVKDGFEEKLYERMFLLEEVTAILDQLFYRFCADRMHPHWRSKILPDMRAWVGSRDDESTR